MAVAFKTALGTGVSVSGATAALSITTTAAIAVDDLVVVRWAADNLSATTPTATCADGGNTYVVLSQGAVNATAGAGVAGGILASKATVARPSGTVITVTLSATGAAHKAGFVQSFTGADAALRSTAVKATGTATAASAGASGTVDAGDLVLGTLANETRNVAITGDSDTTNGSWSTQFLHRSAGSGTDNVCVSIAGQYKIATAAGAQTYNATAIASEWVAMCAVLQATSVTPPNQGSATVANAWATTAAGTAPVALPTGSRAIESGVGRVSEDATARVLESAAGAPKTGTATTTYSEALVASGKKTSKSAVTTTYAETVTGAGKKTPKGAPVTTYTETLTAAGKRTQKATATTAYAYAPTAAGVKPAVGIKQGTATVVYIENPGAIGARASRGTAATSAAYPVTATGAKPAVGMKQGTGLVAWQATPAAVGKRTQKGTATPTWSTVVTAAGKRTPKSTVTTTYSETLAASGKRTQKGSATTAYTVAPASAGKRVPKATVITAHAWTLIAQGVRPVVGAKQGTGLVNYTRVPAATGKRAPKGNSVISVTRIPVATGKKVLRGSATTTYLRATAATGKRVTKGSRTLAHVWVVAAAGARPAELGAIGQWNGVDVLQMWYGSTKVVGLMYVEADVLALS